MVPIFPGKPEKSCFFAISPQDGGILLPASWSVLQSSSSRFDRAQDRKDRIIVDEVMNFRNWHFTLSLDFNIFAF